MKPKEILLDPHQWVPNNARFPVLVYRQAFAGPQRATEIEKTFSANGWTGIWHDGIFDYHHYHSGAHEVLGIAAGTGTLMIGGPGGEKIDVSSGDCLVLPAETGHRNLGSSPDFHVVGAYPPGQHADILTDGPSKEHRASIDGLPVPECDPVMGSSAGLVTVWSYR